MALALIVGTEFEHREGEQPRAQRMQCYREIAPRELLGDNRAADRRARIAVAAEFFGNRPLDQAQLPGLGNKPGANSAALVGLPRRRADLLARERADAVAHHPLLFAQFEAHHDLVSAQFCPGTVALVSPARADPRPLPAHGATAPARARGGSGSYPPRPG